MSHGQSIHVVVIEDNAPDVMLLEESLCGHDIRYEITHYRDGVEAVYQLAHLHTAPPDLIVLDLNMPKMGGLEVLEDIKKNEKLANVPVAILTSSLAPEERQRAQELGANRFMRKPVDLYEYLKQVGDMVRELVPAQKTTTSS
jgi:CheY-like chemotaxis protein